MPKSSVTPDAQMLHGRRYFSTPTPHEYGSRRLRGHLDLLCVPQRLPKPSHQPPELDWRDARQKRHERTVTQALPGLIPKLLLHAIQLLYKRWVSTVFRSERNPVILEEW